MDCYILLYLSLFVVLYLHALHASFLSTSLIFLVTPLCLSSDAILHHSYAFLLSYCLCTMAPFLYHMLPFLHWWCWPSTVWGITHTMTEVRSQKVWNSTEAREQELQGQTTIWKVFRLIEQGGARCATSTCGNVKQTRSDTQYECRMKE